MHLWDKNRRPRSVEMKLQYQIENQSTRCRDEEKNRRVFVLGKHEEECGDGHDHQYNDTRTKCGDLDHDVVERRRVVGTQPAKNRIVERLTRAQLHVLCDFNEYPRADGGHHESSEEEDPYGSHRCIGFFERGSQSRVK